MLCYNGHMPAFQFHKLIFLKLGGSLITDKSAPRTPRADLMARLAAEIKNAKAASGDLRVVLGHGSGSFGHVPAKKYGTRQGVDSPEGWGGFAEVWYEATTLNRILMDVLHAAGLPGIAFPASSSIRNSLLEDLNLVAFESNPTGFEAGSHSWTVQSIARS